MTSLNDGTMNVPTRSMPRAPLLPGVFSTPVRDVGAPDAATRTARPAPHGAVFADDDALEKMDAATALIARVAGLHRKYLATAGQGHLSYLETVRGSVRRARTAVPAGEPAVASAPFPVDELSAPPTYPEGDAALALWMDVQGSELFLSLDKAPWLRDHCPDYGEAVVPMTGVAEIMAACCQEAYPGRKVVEIRDLQLRHWIVVTAEPLRLRRLIETQPDGSLRVTLLVWREAKRQSLSRDEAIATCEVIVMDDYGEAPPAPPRLQDAVTSPNPYASAALFHGPEFQLITELESGPRGANGRLDLGKTRAPIGAVHPVLIDAALQVAADRRWDEWCPGVAVGQKCIPLKLRTLRFFGPTPRRGEAVAQIRGAGTDGGERFPVIEVQISSGGLLWAMLELVLVTVPAGPMDAYADQIRQAFMRDRVCFPGVHLSTFEGEETSLSDDTVAIANWVPATVEAVWNTPRDGDVTAIVAAKEHAARSFKVHPSQIEFDGSVATCDAQPNSELRLVVERQGGRVRVRNQ